MAIFKQTLQPRPAGPSEHEFPPEPGSVVGAWLLRRLARSLSAFRNAGEVVVLLGLAASLDFWDLSRNKWANTYYSAAVRSMSKNWHNFLYASFDPTGLMTVDKPPLALWIEALSVRVFGYHPLSILIPEALMGVATVVLLYDLVRTALVRGSAHLTLEVAVGNEPAIALYRRFGLAPVGVRPNYYHDGDALIMWVRDIDSDAYAERLADIAASLGAVLDLERRD